MAHLLCHRCYIREAFSGIFTRRCSTFVCLPYSDEALGDRHADIRQAMLAAGTTVIDAHGQTQLTALITMFKSYLAGSSPLTETEITSKRRWPFSLDVSHGT
jgi:hypothetical protein